MKPSSIIFLTLAAPFLAAFFCPWVYKRQGQKAVWLPLLGAIIPAGGILKLLYLSMQNGMSARASWRWVDAIPLKFSFVLDGFGGLFALMVAGMGILIIWYAHHYMADDPKKGRFFGTLLFFLGAMLGIPLSNHLFTTFFFWELTSVSSFLLIGFWHEKEKSRNGALKALVMTSTGGLFMMAGFALLGAKTGIWEWTDLPAIAHSVQNESWFVWAFCLILVGVFTKSAQAPFHFWLPDAMEAPTPVSAFLHSSTMVKAGVFLLFRMFPIFSGLTIWFPVLAIVGMTTFLMGAILALKHTDLKAILAYTTIAQLGLFVAMHGHSALDEVLRAGLIFHILAHAFYKGALFMFVGIIDHGTHTRDIRKLGHLKKHMPRTATFFLLAAGSLAGLPPFLGFISKESAIESSLHIAQIASGWSWALPLSLGLGAMVTVGVALKISWGVFFSPAEDTTYLKEHKPHEAHWSFLFPPAFLASLGILFGIFPSLLERLIFPMGMVGLYGLEVPHFALWHGFNLPFLISLLAIMGGFVIFRMRYPIQVRHEKLKLGWNLNTIYEKKWDWVLSTAKQITDSLQNNSLTQYVKVALLFLIGLLVTVFFTQDLGSLIPPPTGLIINPESVTLILVAVAAFMVAWLDERIARIVALGSVGVLVCVYFSFRGAPDLALTGFLVEIIMFVLILIVLNRLNLESHPKPNLRQKLICLSLAAMGGLGLGMVSYLALELPLASSIQGYFTENSNALAGGLNSVNVILVDFRGFDTFGEITVLCMAGLGVFALRRIWTTEKELPPMPKKLKMTGLPPSEILRPVSALLVPLTILFSWYMVYRGHNFPGGGFIGGLITAGGLILELLSVGDRKSVV